MIIPNIWENKIHVPVTTNQMNTNGSFRFASEFLSIKSQAPMVANPEIKEDTRSSAIFRTSLDEKNAGFVVSLWLVDGIPWYVSTPLKNDGVV